MEQQWDLVRALHNLPDTQHNRACPKVPEDEKCHDRTSKAGQAVRTAGGEMSRDAAERPTKDTLETTEWTSAENIKNDYKVDRNGKAYISRIRSRANAADVRRLLDTDRREFKSAIEE